jgi:hypothetical protein
LSGVEQRNPFEVEIRQAHQSLWFVRKRAAARRPVAIRYFTTVVCREKLVDHILKVGRGQSGALFIWKQAFFELMTNGDFVQLIRIISYYVQMDCASRDSLSD